MGLLYSPHNNTNEYTVIHIVLPIIMKFASTLLSHVRILNMSRIYGDAYMQMYTLVHVITFIYLE